ncbi:hypothetical protein [Micromonospora chokoriensis]|uniref:Uncharacterized protein n=1 Tax=Micromonospora chokoriensis TaxID=356851 RepID=A0A1C4VHN1_9ACTN|nr:hypothetical protein [Micromonospora chokoriensis]SCE83497.1 hypothetical protein GA0070612_1451 [Micromonospora chokoriensis]
MSASDVGDVPTHPVPPVPDLADASTQEQPSAGQPDPKTFGVALVVLGIKITLTPDLPLPEGLPITSPIPITFTDPVIDLAYVTSNTLTARPALALSLG